MTDNPTPLPTPPAFEEQAAGPVYSEEELVAAQDALGRLTPEGYAEIVRLIDSLESQAQFPEAQVVFNVDLYGKENGSYVKATVRGANVNTTFHNLMDLCRVADKYGLSLTKPVPPPAPTATTPAPVTHAAPPTAGQPRPAAQTPVPATPAPAGQGSGEIIKIDSISVDFTTTNQPFLRCKGGKFKKFGLACYEEVAKLVYPNFADWPHGEFQPDPEASYMEPDAAGKKVVRFLASPQG